MEPFSEDRCAQENAGQRDEEQGNGGRKSPPNLSAPGVLCSFPNHIAA